MPITWRPLPLYHFPKVSNPVNYPHFVKCVGLTPAVHYIIDEEMDNIDIESIQSDYSTFKRDVPADLWEYELDDIKKLPLERYFYNYKMKYESFENWLICNSKDFISATDDDIYDYYNSFYETGEMQELFEKISNEIFSVMFLNRRILQLFNIMMANILSDLDVDEAEEENRAFFSKIGVLKRARIPQWAKKAVFYRDRGKCVICNKDLRGILSLQDDYNFDHIVPLASGGLNDISNLQLLCENCNKSKGHSSCETSLYYERWY